VARATPVAASADSRVRAERFFFGDPFLL